ncbi:MAG: periplasmic solute binding protein [Pseudomonadota bacterium]|jgi:zinc/manganese transport system substrate-binding protein
MLKFLLAIALLLAIAFTTPSIAKPIHIIAAENFYGSVAKQIGGNFVQVTSILNQPDQDPHLFNLTPSVAKTLEQGDLIIYNGLGYDPWMQNLLSVGSATTRTFICVADLMHKKAGANPHIWYDPQTMSVYAKALRDYLIQHDPLHQKLYRAHYQQFIGQQQNLWRLIQLIKRQYSGVSVIATEPVFGYMAQALGFRMQGIPFQLSMMNGVDPSPKQVQDFQRQLQQHRVKLVFYNSQVSSPLVLYLLHQAKLLGIPIVGVMETQPMPSTYYQWMTNQLKRVEQALDERHRI